MATPDRKHDPLQFLPYEIWLHCLILAIGDSSSGPLLLMSISKNWDQAILEEPELWSTIVIDNNADQLAHIYTFLGLSRGHPLDLIFKRAINIEGCMELLMPHAQRVRSIKVKVLESHKLGEKDILQWFAEKALYYPCMEYLSLPYYEQYDWEKIGSIFPNLQVVHGSSIPATKTLPSNLRDVGNVNIATLEEGISLIQNQNLRYAGAIYPSLGTNISLSDEEWALHASHLKNYSYGQLRGLVISLELRRIGILSRLLSRLPLLHSFYLEIMDWELIPDNWAVQPLLVEDIKHIRKLYVLWSITTNKYVPPSTLQTIIQMFTTHNALVHVEDFNWTTPFDADEALVCSLLYSLTSVQRLTLSLGSIKERNSNPTVVKLDYVYFIWLSSSCLFDYIEAPKAITLLLGHYENTMTSRIPNPSIFDLHISAEELDHVNAKLSISLIESQWQELRTVSLSGIEWPKTVMYMKSLTTVNVSSWGGLMDNLILELLRNPVALPNLHTIKSSEYPMWEPLFELLRRRNRDGHPIERLGGTGYPVPAILSRLVILLQGRQDIYTQKDIDDVIYRRFKDPSTRVKTCFLCASAGYIACPSDRFTEATLEGVDADLLDLWSHEPWPRYQICDSEKWNQVINGDKLRGLRNLSSEAMGDTSYSGFSTYDCVEKRPYGGDITGSMLFDVAPPWHAS